jgi:hypothetical protein
MCLLEAQRLVSTLSRLLQFCWRNEKQIPSPKLGGTCRIVNTVFLLSRAVTPMRQLTSVLLKTLRCISDLILVTY